MKASSESWLKIYRSSVALAGAGLLLYTTLRFPPDLQTTDLAILLAFSIAILLQFPLDLFTQKASLIHVLVLGCGLLVGPTMAGWATALGILAGGLVRAFLHTGKGAVQAKTNGFHYPFVFGLNAVPLVVSLSLFRLENSPVPQEIGNLATWESMLAASLLFSGLHAGLCLIHAGLQENMRTILARGGWPVIAVLELLPLPFLILIVMAYPTLKIGAAFLIAGVSILLEILLYYNSSMRREMDRRVQDLSTLNQVSRTLRSSLEMDSLLEVIHTQVTDLLDVDNFYVALLDPENEQIWYPLAVKHGQRQEWPRRALTDRLTDRVIRDQTPVLLGHHAGDELIRIGLPSGEDAPFAWMGVPLVTPERTIGCLALFSLSEKVEFTSADIEVLNILSGQVSVAIENALLYEKAQRRAIQLETLVHDLRSPLSAVVSAIDVIEESSSINKESELASQAIRIARRSAQRVLGMVESLLDITRFQSNTLALNFAPVSLRKLVAQTLDDFMMQANEFGILLRDEVPADLPLVNADQSKILRVLTNLIDNAVKFTPGGGQITVSAEETSQGMVQVRVSDSGPGIPEEFRGKIFNRFAQVPGQSGRRKGSGLGLMYCRLAVESHGGHIWVEPRPGGGSVFKFTLPLVSQD
jgi:nitrogen-specific signal transduction histidine kinase